MADWMKGAVKHPGALHKELGIPQGKPIPKKLEEERAHMGGKAGLRARLALEFRKANGK